MGSLNIRQFPCSGICCIVVHSAGWGATLGFVLGETPAPSLQSTYRAVGAASLYLAGLHLPIVSQWHCRMMLILPVGRSATPSDAVPLLTLQLASTRVLASTCGWWTVHICYQGGHMQVCTCRPCRRGHAFARDDCISGNSLQMDAHTDERCCCRLLPWVFIS